MAAIIPSLHPRHSQKKFLIAFQFFPQLPLSQVRPAKRAAPERLAAIELVAMEVTDVRRTTMAVISTCFLLSYLWKQTHSGGRLALAENHWGGQAASPGEALCRSGEANAPRSGGGRKV